jgi:16S rRNA (cytosine1402-N4)-methyltransferase
MKDRGRRSTPPGEHRPVLLDEVLTALAPAEGAVVVDCTVGWAGHAAELLRRVGPAGRLIGLDLDPENLPRARERLAAVGHPFALRHSNFAGLPAVLAAEDAAGADAVLADLGMSSMQVDDPERGFSYVRDGPLDMRMDRTRGRTAANLLATISQEKLARALHELGDEPDAERVAALLTEAARQGKLARTTDVAHLLLEAAGAGEPGRVSARSKSWRLHPAPGSWETHPAARTFQALRILVNRELANLDCLLRVLPDVLRPGGRAAVISFHSGEDRQVKTAFRAGQAAGVYSEISAEPIRPSFAERTANPRSRSAKLRWARRARLARSPLTPVVSTHQ